MEVINIQIAATFTAEPVKRSIEFLLELLHVPAQITFSPFNQVFQELLAPTSAFAQNTKGVNIVLLRIEDMAAGTGQGQKLAQLGQELAAAVRAAAARYQVPTLLVLCPPSSATLANKDLAAQLSDVEGMLNSELQEAKGLRLVGSNQLGDLCPVAEYDNPRGQRLGAVPYTPRFYGALGRLLTRAVYRLTTLPHKVIVLDCDQTLWRGVCGEDGLEGIEVDAPRRFLQEFMLRQNEIGILLCLCSKNNEADVWEVFARRSDMLLKREHIVSWRINWERKSENIKSIARELHLGLDSFIFVDDDAAVCAEVEANCPQVLTIRLPEAVDQIPDFLRHYWTFDHLHVTAEDRQRTEMYRQNAGRNRVLAESGSLEDFLQNLELRCEIAPILPEHFERVSQLTQRTNQFNANGIRRTEIELQQFLDGPGAGCQVVHVRDRFGDYGLVGAMMHRIKGRVLEVDTFLLSCRALGRSIEHRMISALGRHAGEAGLDQVALLFRATPKNRPASDFLEKTGAAFKEPDGPGFVFRYPAEAAARVTFAVDVAAVPAPGQTQAATASAAASADDRDVWMKRAKGLHEIASQVHHTDVLMSRLEPASTIRPDLSTTYALPESGTETVLARIWEDLLNVHPIGALDDYFQLGGDSLLAVGLFVEIEEKFGVQLPLATLFTAPTIRKMAQCLGRGDQAQQWRHLVAIQPHGTRPPLFCMHAAGGNVLFYRDLSRHLGEDQPVYGLQAREMPETGRYLDRVEDMAALYLNDLGALQPRGPYYLCGSSFGGLLAYEIAQQLRARGEDVALLALFDTYGPRYPQPLPTSKARTGYLSGLFEQLQVLREQLRQMSARDKLRFLATKASKLLKRIKRKWLWKKNEFQIKYQQALGRELPKDMQRNHKAIQDALDHYSPKRYDGKLTLFRAAIQPRGIVPDPQLGWGELAANGIQVIESPGAHGGMTVDPYAEPLAQKLLAILNRKTSPDHVAQHSVVRSAGLAPV